MADQRRIQRLEQVILRTLGPLISQGLADPRLGVVTVTRIKLSRDLGVARVNWSCIGSDSDRSRAEHGLSHARGHMQSAVAKAMRTRTTPHLTFHYDPSLENSVRINDLLHQLKLERGETDEEDGEGEEVEGGPELASGDPTATDQASSDPTLEAPAPEDPAPEDK
jgi:ribosome-binding factor A